MQVPLPLPLFIWSWCIWCLVTLVICASGLSGAVGASGVFALDCNASLQCSRCLDSVEPLQPQAALPTIALQGWSWLQLSA